MLHNARRSQQRHQAAALSAGDLAYRKMEEGGHVVEDMSDAAWNFMNIAFSVSASSLISLHRPSIPCI
jgi:hypothetical protein